MQNCRNRTEVVDLKFCWCWRCGQCRRRVGRGKRMVGLSCSTWADGREECSQGQGQVGLGLGCIRKQTRSRGSSGEGAPAEGAQAGGPVFRGPSSEARRPALAVPSLWRDPPDVSGVGVHLTEARLERRHDLLGAVSSLQWGWGTVGGLSREGASRWYVTWSLTVQSVVWDQRLWHHRIA